MQRSFLKYLALSLSLLMIAWHQGIYADIDRFLQGERHDELHISLSDLTPAIADDVINYINRDMLTLIHINGNHTRSGDGIWRRIIERLGDLQGNSRLRTLELNGFQFNYDDNTQSALQAVANTFRTNTPLTTLILRRNVIDHEGARELANMLEDNTTLTTFDLGHNNIGPQGAESIARALHTNHTLTTLNLEYNWAIDDGGAIALAEALRTNHTLTTLNLRHNRINTAGIVALAQTLQTNRTLTTLNLGGNYLGGGGIAALAAALRINNNLTTLDLRGDRGFVDFDDDEDARMIAILIGKNRGLTTLHVGRFRTISLEELQEIVTALVYHNFNLVEFTLDNLEASPYRELVELALRRNRLLAQLVPFIVRLGLYALFQQENLFGPIENLELRHALMAAYNEHHDLRRAFQAIREIATDPNNPRPQLRNAMREAVRGQRIELLLALLPALNNHHHVTDALQVVQQKRPDLHNVIDDVMRNQQDMPHIPPELLGEIARFYAPHDIRERLAEYFRLLIGNTYNRELPLRILTENERGWIIEIIGVQREIMKEVYNLGHDDLGIATEVENELLLPPMPREFIPAPLPITLRNTFLGASSFDPAGSGVEIISPRTINLRDISSLASRLWRWIGSSSSTNVSSSSAGASRAGAAGSSAGSPHPNAKNSSSSNSGASCSKWPDTFPPDDDDSSSIQ